MNGHEASPQNGENEAGPDSLAREIQEVAEGLYQATAARFDTTSDTIHRDRFCGYIEPLFGEALAARGIECTEMVVRFPDGRVHRLDQTPDGRLWDPTWQQFLPPDKLSPELPKVLSGTREEIQEYLDRLGVRDQIGAIWSGQEEVDLPETDDEGWGWRGSEPRAEGLTRPDVVVDDEIIEAIKRLRDTM